MHRTLRGLSIARDFRGLRNDVLCARRATAAIPPRRNAKIWQHGNSKAERLVCDQKLRRIHEVGDAAWKKEVGYHRCSLAEATRNSQEDI
jgi:hypothetical protein